MTSRKGLKQREWNGPGLGYRCCGGYISTSLNPGANPLGRRKMAPLSLWKIEIVCELVAETLISAHLKHELQQFRRWRL
jgi:hypothetical protein